MTNRELDNMKPSERDIDIMTASYLETAEWADKPEESEVYAEFDIHSGRQARADCESFAYATHPWLCGDCETDGTIIDWERAGHNFYLSRCGHGAGFFDCDLVKPYGDLLQAKAQKYGAIHYAEYQIGDLNSGEPESDDWLIELA